MIKSIYFPDKSFTTKAELFADLAINVEKIISVKTSEVYKSVDKGCTADGFLLKVAEGAVKVGPQMKDGYIYPIINTTLYLDSHDDVHFNGIWDRSAKEQNGKLFYVADHEIKIDSIIAWPQDVAVMVKSIPWSFVNKDYPGNTEGLIYEIAKDKIVNSTAKGIIEDKRPVQNSVRMQYVKIQMGMNSDAKEHIDYKNYFDKHVDSIANKDVALERGYFFGVEEAKIIKEGSMVVLGSNDATAIRQKDGADTITPEHKTEPAIPATQPVTKFYHDLI